MAHGDLTVPTSARLPDERSFLLETSCFDKFIKPPKIQRKSQKCSEIKVIFKLHSKRRFLIKICVQYHDFH